MRKEFAKVSKDHPIESRGDQMAKATPVAQGKYSLEERQYGAIKIIGIWLAATIPFTILVAAVVPALARALGASEILLYWLLLPANAAWVIGLSLWIIRREEGNLRWETVRGRIWLGGMKDETIKPGCWSRTRVPLGVLAAFFALILGLAVPSIVSMMLYFTYFPAFTNLTEAGSPEFAGWWGWPVFVLAVWSLNTFLAEELLFRGVLLPRMKGAFGRMDGTVNGFLYGLYYLSTPLLIPFRLITGLAAALLAGGSRSNGKALWVRGAEGAAVMVFAWVGVTSTRFTPLTAAPALPMLAGGGTVGEPMNLGVLSSIPAFDPNSGFPFQVNLQSADVSALDLREKGSDLAYACFNTQTVWPSADRMPPGFDPQNILEWGKNPGVGLRELHARGITGRGVGIAIIDQGLLTGHREYAGRLMWYEEITHNLFNNNTAFHASAVSSIAVGKSTGVAPDADLYFIASNDVLLRGMIWQLHYDALGIRRVIELNKLLPADRKIRVISISIGSNPPGMAGSSDFSAAVREAEAAGIYTIFSTVTSSGFLGLAGRSILSDPDDYRSYDQGVMGGDYYTNRPGVLLIPVDSRTLAGPSTEGDYFFCRMGGVSWMMPFSAGLYALAVQVDPSLTLDQFWELAFSTAEPLEVMHKGTTYKIGKLINPPALIAALPV
jgi:membrane protease YdiL (CAAX protease family)